MSLELIEQIRTVTTQINVHVEMILASIPDVVQMDQAELFISSLSYNSKTITATIVMDTFLNVAMTSERYAQSNFPGIF